MEVQIWILKFDQDQRVQVGRQPGFTRNDFILKKKLLFNGFQFEQHWLRQDHRIERQFRPGKKAISPQSKI